MKPSRSIVHAALAGLALTLAVPACSDSTDSSPTVTQNPDVTPSVERAELRMQIRSLFEDRVAWTRAYLVETIGGLAGQDAAAARLMQNGTDLGAAIEPFYGKQAADALTAMLNESVGHAAAAVSAALEGNSAGFESARASWYADADAVASFLADANPAWVKEDVKALLRACIDDAIAEANALMTGDAAASISAFAAHEDHAHQTADALAAGIAQQFSADVGELAVSDHEESLRVAMRDQFFDRATFVRLFLVNAIDELPALEPSVGWLMQNDSDIGDLIRPFYGDQAADQLVGLLDAELEDAGHAITAAKIGDQVGLAEAKASWLTHAEQTADFLAAANPAWPVADLETMLRTCVEDALAEAAARLSGDYPADVSAHDVLSRQARAVADALGAGVAAQFPAK